MISVLIYTKNEERDLPGCLDSVRWCDDVHVFDSLSTDQTVSIARSFGASITSRTFDDESTHKNWGLRNIAFRYPWVLHLDADERATPSLVESALSAVKEQHQAVAYRVRRRDFLQGQWLKHTQATPFYLRLFRPDKMRYARLINPVSLPDGPTEELRGYLDHYPFSKGFRHWLERHNSYSSLEAQQITSNRMARSTAGKQFQVRKAFLAKDPVERRFHQKELFYRLPARPLAKFVLLYFVRGGFLDGGPGFTYSMLQAFYEYMIVLKTRELEQAVVEIPSTALSSRA